jgi:hypothetical protein
MVPLTEQPLHIVIGKGAIAVIGFVATMFAAILILGWLANERDHKPRQPSTWFQTVLARKAALLGAYRRAKTVRSYPDLVLDREGPS